jgi:GMP synthase-like glutamine amidotransferase
MKTVCVLQHVEAEYLGLMEDHLESRNIRFRYVRPFTPGGVIPSTAEGFDGLIILGAGQYGVVSGHLIPSLGAELRLTAAYLARRLPVVGIGAGSCILATAAGGGADDAPLRFVVARAKRTSADALGGHLPQAFPAAVYMRDRPVLPPHTEVLAIGDAGEPLVFRVGDDCIGFLGHPGAKSGMIEDLIMQSSDVPDRTAETLGELRAAQGEIAAALTELMAGLAGLTHWMQPSR